MDHRVQGARRALRDATRDEHDAVDTAFGRHDLSSLEGYSRFLDAQARAFVAVERAIDASDATAVIEDWPQRRRADLLLADLSDLGLTVPEPVEPPVLTSEAEVLGAVYVLEGSRLGGAVLFRSAPYDAPRRFLEPEGTGPRWRSLVALLDARLINADQIDAAVRSARSVFRRFHEAAEGAAT